MNFNQSIKGILFDFDGVLANTMQDHFICWKTALKPFGVELKADDYFPLEGMNVYEIAKKFCRENTLNESCYIEIVKRKKEYYIKNHNFALYPGVNELINMLKSCNVPIGIVTASLQEQLLHSVPLGFLEKFDVIISGDENIRGKPFPDPYLKGLEKLNLKPEECIVVENAPLGIKSAKRAGIFCIAIPSTVNVEKLTDADQIIGKFEDLKDFKLIQSLLNS